MALPVLSGSRITLRQLRQSDAEALAIQANDKEMARFIPDFPSPYTLINARSWINKTLRLIRKDSEYHFCICDIQTNNLIGMIGLRNINRQDLNVEIGYWIGRRYRKRGYCAEAIKTILSYVFSDMGLIRAYAILSEQNKASVRVLENTGFVREATWRKATRVGRKWFNVYSYGILKEEFKPVSRLE
ncbi:MAG: GNAT family N-acetyltransferase [FCB group bacterium]|nr:GNAT family N-acetyltransferase [FCB group bacterium]